MYVSGLNFKEIYLSFTKLKKKLRVVMKISFLINCIEFVWRAGSR